MATSAAGGQQQQQFPEGRHDLRLGDSFFSKAAPSYHTMRYDFKPASVGDCKETYVEVAENQEVTVAVPKLDETGQVKTATVFKGPRKQYQKECLLIYDRETGEFVLEQLTYNIQLKKTRGEVAEEVLENIRETRKTLMHSTATDDVEKLFESDALVESNGAGGRGGGAQQSGHGGGDAEIMSDSERSDLSESDDSSNEGGRSDDDDEDDNAKSDHGHHHHDDDDDRGGGGDGDGDFSEDELAKTLEAELSSAQNSRSAEDGGRTNGKPASSRLQEDLLQNDLALSDED